MKYILSTFLILIISISSKCTDESNSSELTTSNLIGKWFIDDFKTIGEFDGNGQNIQNLRFISPQTLTQSKGKYFNFFESGECQSDLFGEANNLKIDFELKNDSILRFIFNENEEQSFETYVTEKGNEMTWIIDSMVEIKFRKE